MPHNKSTAALFQAMAASHYHFTPINSMKQGNADIMFTDIGEDMDDMGATLLKAQTACEKCPLVIVLGPNRDPNKKATEENSLALIAAISGLPAAQLKHIQFVRYDKFHKHTLENPVQFRQALVISPLDNVDERPLNIKNILLSGHPNSKLALLVQGTHKTPAKNPWDLDRTGSDGQGKKNGVNLSRGQAITWITHLEQTRPGSVMVADSATAAQCRIKSPEQFTDMHTLNPGFAEAIVWNSLYQLVSRCDPHKPYAMGLICTAHGTGVNYLGVKDLFNAMYNKDLTAAVESLKPRERATLAAISEPYVSLLRGFETLAEEGQAAVQQCHLEIVFALNTILPGIFSTCTAENGVFIDLKLSAMRRNPQLVDAAKMLTQIALTQCTQMLAPLYDAAAIHLFDLANQGCIKPDHRPEPAQLSELVIKQLIQTMAANNEHHKAQQAAALAPADNTTSQKHKP